MEFKGKAERSVCYKHRDAYFECAEKLPKDTDPMVACKDLYNMFEKNCGQKWTEHFLRRRDYLKFKEKLEKVGVEEIDKKSKFKV